MSVKKEASGRRSVQVEVEVPGTPEEVWKAIATGPGISSWFVPTEFEERDGKPVAVTSRFGPTHFRGQRSEIRQFVAPVAGTEAEAWATLTAALGQQDLSVGQRWTAPAGVPSLSGLAEYVSQNPYDALLRLDKPGSGVAAVGAFNLGGQSMVALNFYHYGDQAAETAARETPMWQAWFQERFPMPLETSQSK